MARSRGIKIDQARLRMILKNKCITITELAEKTGYCRKALNHAICCESMDYRTLMDVARYLEISPSEISEEVGEMATDDQRIELLIERLTEAMDRIGSELENICECIYESTKMIDELGDQVFKLRGDLECYVDRIAEREKP